MPGRLLLVSEQSANEAVPQVIEHFIWAGNSQTEKDLNLAGQYVRHYDTAGLVQLNSLSLTGAHLSQSLQLLEDDKMPDWAGDNESVWQNKLENEVYATQSTTDATGATLTQTDAKGNMQRLAYNIAGQLKSSWLTLDGQLEQIMVKSLTYSESGQKTREEHGNGVVTKYSYEPDSQRLINITTQRSKGHVFSEKLLQDLLYEYDPIGNVISVLNRAKSTRFWRNQKVSPKNTYTYDSLYQLVQSTGREMADIGQQNNKMPTPLVPLPSDDKIYTTYIHTYSYDRGNNLIRYQDESGTNANDKAQTTFKEGKKIAINQLKIASNFLKDSKNNENALEIYKIFFGSHQEVEQLPQWKKRIDSVIHGLDKLKTTKHVHYQQDKSGSSSTVADLNVDEYKKWSGGNKSVYVNVYSDALKRVYEDPLLGSEHVAHIAIHELSHGVLHTQDHKYIGVLSTPGSHDLANLLNIPKKLQDAVFST